jgi:group I intron endonuclease
MKKTGVVYCFHCIFNGKKYIGKSINLSRRLSRHRRNVKNNIKTKFYSAVKKYGWDGFIFGIVEECEESYLDVREMYYIEKYNTLNEGYNMTSGGDGGKTWVMPEEIRKKYSERMKGFKHTEEAKKKISDANKGRKMSEESKRKLSQKLKGKKPPTLSDEMKKKLSKLKKGVPRSRDVVKKMIETRKQTYNPQNHGSAKKFIFTSPEGKDYEIYGGFRNFCLDNNLSIWSMRNYLKTRKLLPSCKGWSVIQSD